LVLKLKYIFGPGPFFSPHVACFFATYFSHFSLFGHTAFFPSCHRVVL
jgi:hypothetical protein